MLLMNRHDEIRRFEQLLSAESPEWILDYYGIPGIGKTALLDHLFDSLDEKDWLPVRLDFNLSSCRGNSRALLEALSQSLQSRVPSEVWDSYQKRVARNEMQLHLEIKQIIYAEERSTITHPKQTVELGKEGASIFHDAWHEQARVWIELVKHLDRSLVLRIDNWAALIEYGQDDFRAWIIEGLWLRAHQTLKRFRLVVESTRSVANDRLVTKAIPGDQIATVELEPLNHDNAISLMAGAGVTDPAFQEAAFQRVGGHPGLLSLAAALWKERPGIDLSRLVKDLDTEAASVWFVGELLENMKDPRSRKALARGVVLQQWMLEMLSAVSDLQDLDPSWYEAFVDYPFVQDSEEGRHLKKFIELVRRIRLRQIWQQNRPLYQQLHENALEWYTQADARAEGL